MSRLNRFFSAIIEELKDPNALIELEYIWEKTDKCSILLQSGSRKGRVCGMKCVNGKDTCFTHVSLHMCSIDACMRKCTEGETQCEYHRELERKTREQQRPFPAIRWNDPFYIIHGTDIIIDIAHHVIRGYKKEQSCVCEETDAVKDMCTLYQLNYVPYTR
jgi:hypothetical protein